MSASEQQQEGNPAVSGAPESERDATPRIMVGTWAGELAVVEARTGKVCWLRRTKREPGAFQLEGDVAVSVSGMPFAVRRRINSPRLDEAVRRELHVAQETTPAQLEARAAGDGRLLWTYAHPAVMRRLYIEADAGVIVTASDRHSEADSPSAQAFDAATGALLWEIAGENTPSGIVTLRASRGGRLYADLRDTREAITALDMRTGARLWQRALSDHWVLSPDGALIAEHRSIYDEAWHLTGFTMTLIDARDGSNLASAPTPGVIRQLTNDGIVYLDMNYHEEATWIAAVNARTGTELWRTLDVDHDNLTLDGTILSYSRGVQGTGAVEIGALDAATGERLWRWRTPASLDELLRLWGARRMPLMLWDSTEKSAATLANIIGKPWFRLRRPPSHFREPPRRMSPRMRLRGIGQDIAHHITLPLWQEVTEGHWRHPWHLRGGMNASWLAARWGIVFLGTWLGLFALDARDGRLLWHALSTLDLSYVPPTLAP